MMKAALLALALLVPARAGAQVVDGFEDGDFTRQPAWSGDASRFAVVVRAGNRWLATDGQPHPDTLVLATASAVHEGTWRFTFRHEGVNLSNANGVRVYLLADRADLRGEVQGYYVQLGTTNADDVRLYRQDGPPTSRTELGRSTTLLDGDAGTHTVEITRSGGTWNVSINAAPAFTAQDATYARSTHLGVWVKHSSSAAQAFLFDDFDAQGTTPPPDTTPPALAAVEVTDETTLAVRFDERVVNGCDARRYALAPTDAHPAATSCRGGTVTDTLRLALDAPLTPGTTYTLTATGLEDAAGNVQPSTARAFAVPARLAPGALVINEIQYAPPPGLPEYVELLNRTTQPVDLRTATLSDDGDARHALSDAPLLVAPGAYLVVTRDTALLGAAFPGLAAVQPTSWPALNNGGDAVVVRAGGVTIDSVAYAPGWGGQGSALERLDPDGPSGSASNFASSTDPRGGTPGARNSRYAPDLAGPVLESAEETGARVLLLRFDEPLAPPSVVPAAFTPDAGQVVAAVLAGEASVEVHLGSAVVPSRLTVRDLRDLKGTPMRDTTVAVATRPSEGDLVVTEILYAPLQLPDDGVPDQPEYVELFNASGRTLTLRGVALVGAPDEHGVADTLRLPTPLPALPPGGFAVLYDAEPADGDPATDSRLARAFPETDFRAPGVVLVPLSSVTSGGLSNGGERLRLVRGAHVLETVDYRPEWHDGGLATTSGVALERIAPAAPPSDPLSWASSSAPRGGTPGAANSVGALPGARPPRPGDLVLNEVLYRPRADARDALPDQTEYVEVFNRSDAVLDLNGLVLRDAPDEHGDVRAVRLVFRPAALPPGGHAVLFRASGLYAEGDPAERFVAAFPGAAEALLIVQRATAFALPDGGRTLVLADAAGAVLDSLAYAPSWHASSVRDETGVSLERIDPAAPSDEPTNWSSSAAAAGGTPGQRNSLTRDPAAPAPDAPGLVVEPSPFSPDGDGFDDATAIRYRLSTPTASLRVRIFDQQGRLVRTLTQARLAGPEGQLVWDGRDDAGRALRIGIYVVLAEALDAQRGHVEAFRAPVVLARPLD